MSTEKRPRPQVNDLGPLQQLMPQADPRTADTYVRPQEQEVMRPNLSNPMTQLAESLQTLNKDLSTSLPKIAARWTEEEEAKLISDFQANRQKWNQAVRNGEVPLGASPHAARAVKRLMLSELADSWESSVSLAFQGPEGAEARESNNPEVMRNFLNDQRQKFYAANLKNGDRDLYEPLDVQEAFQPKLEKATSKLMGAHAQYRVAEVERELVDTVGASVSRTIEDTFATFTPETPDELRQQKLREASQKISSTLYDPDHGAVRNGLPAKKGGDLLVDTIVARAVARQDRSVLDLIDHVERPRGEARLADVAHVQQKRVQAEEHITSLQIQAENHAWQQEQRPYQRESLHRQAAEYQQQDARWEQERQSWLEHSAGKADGEILRSLTRRLYEGMDHPDSKRGVQIINDVLKQAKASLPERVEHLNELLAVTHQRKAHTQDDPQTVASIYLQLAKDPLGFDDRRLAREVKNGNLTVSTMRGIWDDLDRKRNNAQHPLMRQPEFGELLHAVGRGALQNPDDEFSAEGQLRASQAIGSFRDSATEWIEKNPQGSAAAFRQYMRAQVAPVIEQANRVFGQEQERLRKKEVEKGSMVVGKTQQAIADRESKAAAAAELERSKQAKEQQLKTQRELFNSNFKPSGKKTEDGRPFLVSPTGAVASEQTITIHGVAEINGGGITNIPTIFGGKKYSDEDAIEIMRQNKGVDPDTGKPVKRYYSIKDAEIAAREKSNRLAKEYQSKK